jgi:hypothetical protein
MHKLTLLLFIVFGLLYSCAESPKSEANVEKKNPEKEAIYKMSAAFHKPDSLRSAEEKTIVQQIELLVFGESITGSGGRFEIAHSKADLKEKGISEIYYDLLKKELDYLNMFLDTMSLDGPTPIFKVILKSEFPKEISARMQEEALRSVEAQHPE